MDQQNITTLVELIPAAAIAALVGSTLAFAGVVYTNRKSEKRMIAQHEHERRLKLQDVKRERAEELYVLLKKWEGLINSTNFIYLCAIEGKISADTASRTAKEKAEEESFDISKPEALIALYFPSLKEVLNDIRKGNEKLLELWYQYNDPISEQNKKSVKLQFKSNFFSLLDEIKQAHDKLAKLVHDL